MSRQEILLHILADGLYHSGQDIGDRLGISRTAVWKHIQSLEDLGLDVFKVRGKGYRLPTSIELLDKETIRQTIKPATQSAIQQLDVQLKTDSTNQQLLNRAIDHSIHGHAVLAEYQTHGRGRRGRDWVSPFASGVYLSIGWRFDPQPDTVSALSLATGVAVIKALKDLGIHKAGLKWPNDIITANGKLGGILLENRSEMGGYFDVILGVGINYALNSNIASTIDQKTTDIQGVKVKDITRNELAGKLLDSLFGMLELFSSQGFSPFLDDWVKYDQLAGRRGSLQQANKHLNGKIIGVDDKGLLIMEINGKRETFHSGELSLRSAP